MTLGLTGKQHSSVYPPLFISISSPVAKTNDNQNESEVGILRKYKNKVELRGKVLYWEDRLWSYMYVLVAVIVQLLSCVRLCNPMDCSTPGFPVHHQFLELAQTHVCRVGDTVQPSRALSSPSPPAVSLSQHQMGLFQWVSSLHQVVKVLELQALASVHPVNIQDWLPLGLTGLTISFLSKALKRVFSSTTIWKHQFFSAQPFLLSSSHIHTWLLEKPFSWLYRPL